MLTRCHSSRRSETRLLFSIHKRHSTGIVWSNNYIAKNSTESKHVMSTVHGQFPKWSGCCNLYCQVSASISITGWCRIERKESWERHQIGHWDMALKFQHVIHPQVRRQVCCACSVFSLPRRWRCCTKAKKDHKSQISVEWSNSPSIPTFCITWLSTC